MLTNNLTCKPYHRANYLYLVATYRHHSAPALAAALDRQGSLYRFISRHLELRKQGKA